jgi:hypothetical protein
MATTPTRAHAAGMLAALKSSHNHGLCLSTRCVWDALNLDSESDRRVIQSVYANEARAAMGRVS